MKNDIDLREGTLAQVALVSLIGTLHTERQSGTLHVSSEGLSKRIHFKNGEIVFASSSAAGEKLGELLIRNGTIKRSDFDLVYTATRETRLRLGKALVEMGYLSSDEMQTRVIQQVETIIYSLFDWSTGRYRSEESEHPVDEDLLLDLSTRNIILEGGRRTLDLEAIRRGLGDPKAVVRFSVALSSIYEQMRLRPEEAFLLSRIDGSSNIAEILTISPLGEQATLSCLLGLVSAGILVADIGDQAIPRIEHDRLLASKRNLKETGRFRSPNVGYPGSEQREAVQRIERTRNVFSDPLDRHEIDASLKIGPTQVMTEIITESPRPPLTRPAPSPERQDSRARRKAAQRHYEEGRRFFADKQFFEAVQVLKDAVRLDPDRAVYHKLLAKALSENPKWRRKAAEHFKRAIELEPFDFESYLGLGLVFEASGMSSRAKKHFEEALTLDPDNKLAMRMLDEQQTVSKGSKELFGLVQSR